MREELAPVLRALRWYLRPPAFLNRASFIPSLSSLRVVGGLAAFYLLGRSLGLPVWALNMLGILGGLTITVGRSYKGVWDGNAADHGIQGSVADRQGREAVGRDPERVGARRVGFIRHGATGRRHLLRVAHHQGRTVHFHARGSGRPEYGVKPAWQQQRGGRIRAGERSAPHRLKR